MRGSEINLKALSECERGYLFGIFEGDGYKIYDKKSRHYHIEFYLNSEKDKEIIQFVIFLLKKINLKPATYKDKRFNCLRIRVYSKSLFNLINKNIKLNDKNKEFDIGFISGLIDSEGCVNCNKNFIMIINTNKKILDDCKDFLNSIGIKSSINLRKPSFKDKKNSYRMYISVSFKRLKHLSKKAGKLPSSGVDISQQN